MKTFVSALEIIGHQQFWANNPVETRTTIFSDYLSAINLVFQDKRKTVKESGRAFKLILLANNSHIVIQSIDASPLAFGQITSLTQEILLVSLTEGFPLRGCVDSIPANKRILELSNDTLHYPFKMPTKGAFPNTLNTGMLMQWSGCLLTVKALDAFEKGRTKQTASIDDFVSNQILHWYPVPQVDNHALAINWLFNSKVRVSLDTLEELFSKHSKGIPDEQTANLVLVTHDFASKVVAPVLN